MVSHLKSKRQQVASSSTDMPFWEHFCMPSMLSLGWRLL